jgi:hypothetical protein
MNFSRVETAMLKLLLLLAIAATAAASRQVVIVDPHHMDWTQVPESSDEVSYVPFWWGCDPKFYNDGICDTHCNGNEPDCIFQEEQQQRHMP